jgi:hypothetical protein
MRYDNRITLSENKKIILEQGNPPIPMPSTQLPSDYTGSGGGFERTQTPTISQERTKSEKLKQQEIDKNLNRSYPSNKEEGDRFRAWFNQVFPFKAKNPCGDGQKLDLTGTFDNKFVKCAADFDKYGKRAFKMFLEQKGGVLKVYKSVVDREKQTGVPIGYTNEGWKEYQVKKQEREKECQPKRVELLRKIDEWKKNNPNSMYIPDEYLEEEKKLNEYCSTEIENLKFEKYNPNFPFGLSEVDSLVYYTMLQALNDRYPNRNVESCRNEKYWKSKGFSTMDNCIGDAMTQEKMYKDEINELNKKYGYKPKPKGKEENLFDEFRLLFEFVGMGLITLISTYLAGQTGGLTTPLFTFSAARLALVYELVLSAGFFGSLAKYDYDKGETNHAKIDIIFIFLPLIHKMPGISQYLSKFSSEEIIKSSRIIAQSIAKSPINNPQQLAEFIKTLDPITQEIFVKALKIDGNIIAKEISKLGEKAISKLGPEKSGKIALDVAKEMGIKTSLTTGGKFLTNSAFVNGINRFAAALSVDLPVIELFGNQIYKLLDGENHDLSVQLKNLENYYKTTYKTPEKITQAILDDTKKLEKGDKQTQEKIKNAAKGAFTKVLSSDNNNGENSIDYDSIINIKVEN